jgi:hypothetical protein
MIWGALCMFSRGYLSYCSLRAYLTNNSSYAQIVLYIFSILPSPILITIIGLLASHIHTQPRYRLQ